MRTPSNRLKFSAGGTRMTSLRCLPTIGAGAQSAGRLPPASTLRTRRATDELAAFKQRKHKTGPDQPSMRCNSHLARMPASQPTRSEAIPRKSHGLVAAPVGSGPTARLPENRTLIVRLRKREKAEGRAFWRRVLFRKVGFPLAPEGCRTRRAELPGASRLPPAVLARKHSGMV